MTLERDEEKVIAWLTEASNERYFEANPGAESDLLVVQTTIMDLRNQRDALIQEVEWWKAQWDGAQDAIKRLNGIPTRHEYPDFDRLTK
jgi:hypothetical protein